MSSHTLHVGHVMDVLAGMPDDSVHCVVTSPPYWGLRDYGIEPSVWPLEDGDLCFEHRWGKWSHNHDVREETKSGKSRTSDRCYGDETRKFDGNHQKHQAGQFCQLCDAWRGCMGLEPTPNLYVKHMVLVFREIRRVLRPDGVCWLNLGDSYTSGGRKSRDPGVSKKHPAYAGNAFQDGLRPKTPDGLKPKDRCMMPARVALALQADGWWLRDEIIWHKPNPMPSSVTDRTTTAHEMVYLLTKSAHYYYDADAIREPVTGNAHARGDGVNPKAADTDQGQGIKQNSSFSAAVNELVTSRNKRSVWTIPTAPYSEAHFATFPPSLVVPMIKAGTSERGCCPTCGKCWERVVEKRETNQTQKMPDGFATHPGDHGSIHRDGREAGMNGQPVFTNVTVGWRPGCKCHEGIEPDPVPCTVFDPFAGSGTTLGVARQLGRNAIGCEQNPDYAEMAEHRIARMIRPGTARIDRDEPAPLFTESDVCATATS